MWVARATSTPLWAPWVPDRHRERHRPRPWCQEFSEPIEQVAHRESFRRLSSVVSKVSPAPGGPCRRTGAWGAGRVDDGTQRDTPHSGYRTVYVSVAPADGPRSRFSKFTASVVVPRLVSLSA